MSTDEIQPVKMCIGGERLCAASGRTYDTVNPATEAVVTHVPDMPARTMWLEP